MEDWPDLPDRPWRVLARMAFVAHDEHKQPLYWRGRDDLVAALGLPVGATNSYRAVRRAVADLVDAGAIERAGGGYNGKSTRYELTLERTPTDRLKALQDVMREGEKGDSGDPLHPVDNGASEGTKGDSGDPLKGDRFVPEGGQICPGRGTQVTPGGLHEEERGTKEEEEQTSSPSPHLGAVDTNDNHDLDLFTAKRILSTSDDLGRALIKQAPFGVTGSDAVIWAARQKLASRSAS